MTYIGFAGSLRTIEVNQPLGVGVQPEPKYGFRRAVWDVAFGHVSGFRKRDIAYYVATRSLSRWIWIRVQKWEAARHAERIHRLTIAQPSDS